MQRVIAGILLALLPAVALADDGSCINCIFNSAAPQNAQFNVSSATIRGVLTVGTLNLASITTSGGVTGSLFTGSGAGLTNLNASQLLTGTIPSAAVAGAYSGITGVGTLASGSWHGSPVGTQYGGTGQNLVAVATGSIIYFSGNGVMSTLAPSTPQALLQTNGSAAPSWTLAPSVSGTNIYGIPLTSLSAGTLPTDIIVTSNSIPHVAGASIVGNISGAAAIYTGPIQFSQLPQGVIPSTITASSITASGVVPGVYGGPSTALGSQITFGSDGRATSASQAAIALPLSQLVSGTLPGGVAVPAANIQAGILGAGVQASSLTAIIAPGVCGVSGFSCQANLGADGRVDSYTNVPIITIGASTSTAYVNLNNVWTVQQNFAALTASKLTAASSVTASAFFGDGSHLSGVLSPSNSNAFGPRQFFNDITVYLGITGGTATFSGAVIGASSITASAFFGDGSHLTNVSSTFNGGTVSGQATFLSSVTVLGSPGMTVKNLLIAGNIVSMSSVTASAFFGDVSNTTGQICGNGAGGASILCEAITGSMAGSDYSVVSGGRANLISGSNAAIASVISGGGSNSITQSDAVVAGGASNALNSQYGVIGGGFQNSTSGAGAAPVISGGEHNTTSGNYAVIPGGFGNAAAGSTSFAGGLSANADHNGSFVWGDSNSTGYHSHGVDTVNLQAHGGAFVDSGSLTVSASSVTASAFFGDGSHLTGISTSFTGGTVPNETDFISSVTFHTTANIGGVNFVGAKSNTQLRALACTVLPCQAQSTTDFDVYTATATSTGAWRNSRTGVAP